MIKKIREYFKTKRELQKGFDEVCAANMSLLLKYKALEAANTSFYNDYSSYKDNIEDVVLMLLLKLGGTVEFTPESFEMIQNYTFNVDLNDASGGTITLVEMKEENAK